MISAIKILTFVAAAVVIVFWIPLGQFRYDIGAQLAIFLALFVVNALFKSDRLGTFMLSITLFMVLFGVTISIFAKFGWGSFQNFWKIPHFASSMLAARFLIGLISFRDLIALPLSEQLRRDLLLVRSLLEHGGAGVHRIGWYCARLGGRQNRFLWGLATVLGAFIWLQAEAIQFSSVIENRTRWLLGEIP